MYEPIVFISKHRIKAGKLDRFTEFAKPAMEVIKANKPGTVAFLAYTDDTGTELTIVHIFPDQASMDLHLEGAGDRSAAAYEFLEPIGFEIYGKPSDSTVEVMKTYAHSGVTLTIKPQLLNGYLRLKSG